MTVTPRYLEPSPRRRRHPPRRRRGLPLRSVGLGLLVGVIAAVVVVLVIGLLGGGKGKSEVERFGSAWERGDYQAMYGLLDADSQQRVSRAAFARAYRAATLTATTTKLEVGEPDKDGEAFNLPVRVTTRAFGLIRGDVRVPVDGDAPRIRWALDMTFPGLRDGERLRRVTRAPRRAPLLARNGRTLADRNGDQTQAGSQTGITGELGEAKGARRLDLVSEGFPANARVGVSGLQRVLDRQLRGRAGGTLYGGKRILARTQPRPARAVRSSIDTSISSAAQSALAGRFGAVAAIQPRTGEVLGLAGIALDGAQAPGSTFKIMTVTAGLESGVTKLSSSYPVQTGANAGGRYISNAHGEACGGSLTESFSKSCNSVFGPMGAKVGNKRLVAVAERFGFNHPTGVPGATEATIPKQNTPVEVGASAIGQGRVLTTALNMAVVGATIANKGRRPLLTLQAGKPRGSVRATSPRVAALVTRLMESVVTGAEATGNAAQISGVRVAGKTGTAEVGGGQPDNAWFVAFAPAQRPTLAVGVLVVGGGAGGDAAAPIARDVLQSGL
jgi:peptidoglycan glycosyltransferase